MEIINIIINNDIYAISFSLVMLIFGFLFGRLIFKGSNKIKVKDEASDTTEEPVEEAIAMPKNPAPINLPLHSNPPCVLIAEDNNINATFLIKSLKRLNITNYIHVLDGKLAFEARKNDKSIDIILMDINMPNMTGDEATQEIIKWENENNYPHIPIIAVTANALVGDRERFLAQGMEDYTTKPVNMKAIGDIIRHYTGYSAN